MNRLDRLRSNWDDGIDAYLIMQPENRRYLSAFTGSAGFLLISNNHEILAADFRYWEQVRQQSPEWELFQQKGQWVESLQEIVAGHGWRTVALEAESITLQQKQKLEEQIPQVSWVSFAGKVEKLRSVKDEQELEAIAQAVALADLGFQHILGYIRPGISEREIALELEFYLRKNGAQGISFEFIVASGCRSSLPHGVASEKILQKGEFVTIDYGCVLNGYCSDTTRTIVLGHPNDEQKQVYGTVLEAQKFALDAVAPGKAGKDVDRLAREVIERAGYGDKFGHGLGHGVGLVVHENPRLSASSEDILEPGHVVTIEPGIYIPKWGGVRIEDMVIVTNDGCRNLTTAPKDLIIL